MNTKFELVKKKMLVYYHFYIFNATVILNFDQGHQDWYTCIKVQSTMVVMNTDS